VGEQKANDAMSDTPKPLTSEIPPYPLTVSQAARYSGLRESTLKQAISTGALKTVTIPTTRTGIDPESLKKLIEYNKRFDALVTRALAGEDVFGEEESK
jgi:hypothetical protein